MIIAKTEASLADAISALNTAHSLSNVQFSAYFAGSTKTSMVRTVGDVIINPVSKLSAEWTSQLVADDPRRYGDLISVAPIGVNEDAAMVNLGDIEAPLYLHITGKITHLFVTVTVRDPLWPVTFSMSSAYTLAAGHTLDISTADHTVYDGTISKQAYIGTRNWLMAPPGESFVSFAGSSPVGTPTLTVTARSAWR